MMDAGTNIKGRSPNRHATDAPARAARGPTNAALPPVMGASGVAEFFRKAEIFKKTPYAPGLKPGGRYIAKDMYEVAVIPLLMKTLLDHGPTDGDCFAVAGQTTAENLKSVKPVAALGGAVVKLAALLQDGDIIKADAGIGTNVKLSDADLGEYETKWRPQTTNDRSGALWKYAQQIGPAVDGAVTHPGAAHEKQCYADI